jgi:hypothetical protein
LVDLEILMRINDNVSFRVRYHRLYSLLTCTAQVTSSMANNNGVSFEQREAGSSDALELQQTAPLTDEPFVDFDWDISLNLNEWPL